MSDRAYFTRRAEQEVELAQAASHPAAVAAHYQMSSLYFELADANPATAEAPNKHAGKDRNR